MLGPLSRFAYDAGMEPLAVRRLARRGSALVALVAVRRVAGPARARSADPACATSTWRAGPRCSSRRSWASPSTWGCSSRSTRHGRAGPARLLHLPGDGRDRRRRPRARAARPPPPGRARAGPRRDGRRRRLAARPAAGSGSMRSGSGSPSAPRSARPSSCSSADAAIDRSRPPGDDRRSSCTTVVLRDRARRCCRRPARRAGLPAARAVDPAAPPFTGIFARGHPVDRVPDGDPAIGGTRAGILMLFEPVVGVALAAWLLGEGLARSRSLAGSRSWWRR